MATLAGDLRLAWLRDRQWHFFHAANSSSSTKSKLHRNLVMSSEADYASQVKSRHKPLVRCKGILIRTK